MSTAPSHPSGLRVTARISEKIRDRLEQAAVLAGLTLNQFLVNAALKEANALIEQERVINLSLKDAEVFFNAIDNPPAPHDKLVALAQRYKTSGIHERSQHHPAESETP